MKTIPFFISVFFSFLLKTSAQDYTWVRGSNNSGPIGNYGTVGVPLSTNDPGGRHGCAKWTDNNGNLWLFGGEGYTTNNTVCWMNDLWKYDRSTNQWTWMRGSNSVNPTGNYGTLGVSSPANDPSAREFGSSWVDASGNLWLFGGEMGVGTKYNDLWKYDPTTNQWTWIKGANTANQFGIYGTQGVPASANTPGGRTGMATWTDNSGNFWFFAGRGYTDAGFPGFLSDTWKYNVASNQWTWVSGTNLTGQAANYGTQGVPSNTNIPSARDFPGYWKDHLDRLYVFGGRGTAYFSDLWRFDPAAGTWVWLKGPNIGNQFSTYGTVGNFAPANNPGGRWTPASWIDNYGYLWLFGGNAWATSTFNQCNDLWRYDPCTNNWAFMKGAQVPQATGVYGTMGTPAIANTPGARFFNTWWKDPVGDLWLFGGEGYATSTTTLDHMNDLWKFKPLPSADSINATPAALICAGNNATLTAYSNNAPVTWYNSPTTNSISFSGNPFITPTLTTGSSPTVITYYAQTSCTSMPRASMSITVYPYPIISVTGPTGVCVGNAVTFTATGASTYTWSTGGTGSVTTLNQAQIIATISAKGSNDAGCISITNYSLSLLPLPNVVAIPSKTFLCSNYGIISATSTLTGSGALTYTWNASATGASTTIAHTTNGTRTVTVSGTDVNGCVGTNSIQLLWVTCEGINEETWQKLNVDIYPNPTIGKVSLRMGKLNSLKQVTIYNSVGAEVYKFTTFETSHELLFDQPQGLYHVIVTGSEGNGGAILIKQ